MGRSRRQSNAQWLLCRSAQQLGSHLPGGSSSSWRPCAFWQLQFSSAFPVRVCSYFSWEQDCTIEGPKARGLDFKLYHYQPCRAIFNRPGRGWLVEIDVGSQIGEGCTNVMFAINGL